MGQMGQEGARMNVIRVEGSYVKRSGVFLPRELARIKFNKYPNWPRSGEPAYECPELSNSFVACLGGGPWLEPGVCQAQYPKEVRKVHERIKE